MTDQPTPTPRTDAAWQSVTVSAPWDAAAEQMAQHARELERELRFNEKVSKQIWSANERLKRELDEAREQIAANHKATELIERMLYAERALADRLGSVLDEIAGAFKENGWVLRPAITEALAAWKEARNDA